MLPSGYEAVYDNPTHTRFSSDLMRFLFKDLELPTTAEFKTFADPFSRIDWSSSDKVSVRASPRSASRANER